MIKKHLPLIVAIALPIIFIGILAAAILIPSMRMNPQHDFVYFDYMESNAKAYPYAPVVFKNEYYVLDGKIAKRPLNAGVAVNQGMPAPGETYEYREAPTLLYYSMADQASREISYEDALKLSLVAGPSSPDGYTVKFEYNNDGIFELFGSDTGSEYVITKGAGKKILGGIVNDKPYYGGSEITVVGWVNK